ncbi:hypothetical protein PFISCL1PPCAC_7349, partial [Pristionchus fissidentatus]
NYGSRESEEVRRLRLQREEMQRAHEAEMKMMKEQMEAIKRSSELQRLEANRQLRGDMNEMKRQDQQRTQQLQYTIDANRREAEDRRRSQEAREATDRAARDRKWREQQEMMRRREEKEREQRERERRAENLKWDERNRAADLEYQTMREGHDREMSRIREDRDNKLREMVEESDRQRLLNEERVREEREKIGRAHQEYYERWNSMMREMLILMRERMWSQQIEKKWATRLAGLRDAHTPVRHSFNNLRYELENLTRTGILSAFDRSEIEVRVTLLIDQLNVLIDIMANEVEDMRRMVIEHPEAKFLVDIEQSSDEIRRAAVQMLRCVDDIERHLKCEFERPLSGDLWRNCERSFEELERNVERIPTTAGLRMKYQPN